MTDREDAQRAELHDSDYVPIWSTRVDLALLALATRHMTPSSTTTLLIAEARTGFLAEHLLRTLPHQSRLMLVEPRKALIDRARKRLSHTTQHLYFDTQSAQQLSYADDVFQWVLCSNGLLTQHETRDALTEFVRVLQPGGIVGLAIPTRATFQCFTDMLLEATYRIESPTVRKDLRDYVTNRFNAQEILDLLDNAGIEPIDQQQVAFEIEFFDAEDLLFSSFVESTFLPGWLALCRDDSKREPLFFDLVQAINTYFEGIPFTTFVDVFCVLGRLNVED